MAAVTAAAIGAVAVGASVYGANKAAGAAKDAANAQSAQSSSWLADTQMARQQALDAYGSYSSTQASEIDKAIASQERNVGRQEQLVQSIDPSLISAGKQMNDLLQGQSAPVLQNIKDQRQLQRQNLLDTLRQQYGPGAETSSAGVNALQKFDSETANSLSSAQQSYLSSVSNIALGGAKTLGASLGEANDTLANLGNQYGNIGMNQAKIIQGGTADTNNAQASTVNSAGAAGVGGAMQGSLYNSIGQGIGKVGGLVAGFGSTPSQPGSTPLSSSVTPTPGTGAGTYSNVLGGNTLASNLGNPNFSIN